MDLPGLSEGHAAMNQSVRARSWRAHAAAQDASSAAAPKSGSGRVVHLLPRRAALVIVSNDEDEAARSRIWQGIQKLGPRCHLRTMDLPGLSEGHAAMNQSVRARSWRAHAAAQDASSAAAPKSGSGRVVCLLPRRAVLVIVSDDEGEAARGVLQGGAGKAA
eukprot:CAMPEP_0119344298 /NCGR_PEP_ID=MMETSP1333-20130426/106901_1 /TAXON_ID=418940 /ORGANISM="Scyphosphaera apsteinii, Strain RCC1455" /LENGTH=161 /DNA_ID=CAMNT_0007356735 /DNA_START=238 /DNA_END=725 /DNA_ORIENTATION=+